MNYYITILLKICLILSRLSFPFILSNTFVTVNGVPASLHRALAWERGIYIWSFSPGSIAATLQGNHDADEILSPGLSIAIELLLEIGLLFSVELLFELILSKVYVIASSFPIFRYVYSLIFPWKS